MRPQSERAGVWLGALAYGLWGLFPLYWPLLRPSGAGEILASRMAWALVAVGIILLIRRQWSWLRALLGRPRRLLLLAGAATVISVNWGVYIWAVNAGRVVEAALGYFINPLVTIALGVLVLRERLRPAQWAAVGIGVIAVLVLAIGYGRLPWISLTLAFSFGTYGLLKKKAALGGLESLAAETGVLFLPAVGYLLVINLVAGDGGTYRGGSAGHLLLLALSGVVTAIPLLCFGAAAVRIPLSTIGLLQYLTPVFQFLLGVTVDHERMPLGRWLGFCLVWLALLVLTSDALRAARASRSGSAPRGRADGEGARTAARTPSPH
jgi:chloramphenicol-sensitive protein RarD